MAPAHWPGFAVHKIVDTSYDALDRKTREAVSGVGVTEYGYDLAGRLKCTAVRMNPDVWAAPLGDKCVPGPAHAVFGQDRISQNLYNGAGDLLESWDGVGTALARREALYQYNRNGKKTSLTDARGFRAEMTYDGFDRQMRWVFPSKTTPGAADQADFEEYAYDADGNRIAMRKRDGSVLGFQYGARLRRAPALGRDPWTGSGRRRSAAGGGDRTTYNGDNKPTLVETGSAVDRSDAALAALSADRQVAITHDPAGRKASESVVAGGAIRGRIPPQPGPQK